MSVNKFKVGDMVYLIGFGCLEPRKLQTGYNNGSPMKFKVEVAKEAFVKEQANKFKSQIDPRAYNALMNYEVGIDD